MNRLIESTLLLEYNDILTKTEVIKKVESLEQRCKEHKEVLFELHWGGGRTVSLAVTGFDNKIETGLGYFPNVLDAKALQRMDNKRLEGYLTNWFKSIFSRTKLKHNCRQTNFYVQYHEGRKVTL